MSWQEELRRLDEELAAGRMSADDYRIRRDRVLSAAVGSDDQPVGGSRQEDPPTGASGNQPAQTQDDPGSESTQFVAPVTPPGQQHQQRPDMPGHPQQPAGPPPQQPPPRSPVSGQPQPPVASHGNPPQQPGWNAPDQDMSPPWSNGDLPPIDAARATGGSDSFTSQPTRRNTGKIIGGVCAVVLLAGIGVGAWFLWGAEGSPEHVSNASTNTSTTSSQSPTATTTTPPKLPIAELPGSGESYDSIKSFDDIDKIDYLNKKEHKAYEDAGAGDVSLRIQSLSSDGQAVILVTQVDDADAAEDAAEDQRDIQLKNDAKKASDDDLPDDLPDDVLVTEYTDPDSDDVQIRAHYVSDDAIVRVEIRNTKGMDEAHKDLDTVLTAQLKVMPADE